MAACGLLATPAAAQTWNNPANGAFETGGNWVGGVAPVSAATTQLTFGSAAANGVTYTATNNTANFLLNAVTFAPTGGTTVTVASAGAGSLLNFTGTAPFITHGTAGTAVFSSPVNVTPAGATGVDYSVLVNMNSTGSLTFAGALGGAVSNGGTSDVGFTSGGAGTGTLAFTGGGTTGFLRLNNPSVDFNGGTYNLQAAGNDTPSTAVPTPPPSSPFILAQGTGNNVTATIRGGTVINSFDNIYFANLAGSTANVTISGAGTVVNSGFGNPAATSGRFGPGNQGTGNVTVSAGAQVNSFFVFQSRLSGSSSDVIVDGAGSRVFSRTQGTVGGSGQFTIGNQSTGTWTVRNGATSVGRSIILGNTALDTGPADTGLGNGTLTVTGTGSVVTAGGPGAATNVGELVPGAFTVGSAGNGRLNVLAGGVVSVNTDGGGTPAGGNLFAGVNATLNTGLTARIDVDGAGSQLNVANQFSLSGGGPVGAPAGAVTFNVTNGGLVNTGGTTIYGQSAGGSTTVTLNNGQHTTTGQLQMNQGTIVVNVQGGGRLTAGGIVFVATNAGSTANVTVTGANSLFAPTLAASQLQLGGQGTTPGGTATVTASAGGTVSSPALVALFGGATLNVNAGGLASFGTVADGVAGTSAGAVAVATGTTLTITGAVAGPDTGYSGAITGPGGVSKAGTGLQVLAGNNNTYAGGTTVSGLLAVANTTGSATGTGPVTVASGGTLIGTGIIGGQVTVATGGTLSAGVADTGVLRLNNAVGLAAGSTLNIGINGTTAGSGAGGHDQINLGTTGSIMFNGATLDVAANTNDLTAASVITIILGPANSIGAGNIFAGRANGSQFLIPNAAGAEGVNNFYQTTIFYDYAASNVRLTNFVPVPEPAHLLVLAAAAGGIGRRLRRRTTAVPAVAA